jgi:hypothetical protein
MLRNSFLTGSATNRTLAYHPITPEHARALIQAVFQFWVGSTLPLPLGAQLLLAALAGAVILAGLVVLFRDVSTGAAVAGVDSRALTAASAASYVVFLVLAITFVDAHTPLDARTLVPFNQLALAFFVATSWRLGQGAGRWTTYALALSTLLLLGASTWNLASTASRLHSEGAEFASRSWRQSETLACVQVLPEEMSLYSNGFDAIEFLLDRPTSSIPRRTDPVSMRPNPSYRAEIEVLKKHLNRPGAAFVYLNAFDYRWYFPEKAALETELQLPPGAQFSDGTIYVQGGEQLSDSQPCLRKSG